MLRWERQRVRRALLQNLLALACGKASLDLEGACGLGSSVSEPLDSAHTDHRNLFEP